MKHCFLLLGCLCLFSACGGQSPTPDKQTTVTAKAKSNAKVSQLRSFEVTDVEGESSFQVQINGTIVGITPKDGVVEKSLPLQPGKHTITITRISGTVKQAEFKVVLDSIQPYSFEPDTSLSARNSTIEFHYGVENGKNRDELGYRIVMGSLRVNESITLKVNVGKDT